ncbi:MAG: hypothetical protein AAFU51_19005, partial [Bacteroidota bacterium]
DGLTGEETVLGLARIDASVETLEIIAVPETEDADPVIEEIDVRAALASGRFDTGEKLDGPATAPTPFIPKLGIDRRGDEGFQSVQLENGDVLSVVNKGVQDGRVQVDLERFDSFGNRTEIETDFSSLSSTTTLIAPLSGGGFLVESTGGRQIFDAEGEAIGPLRNDLL